MNRSTLSLIAVIALVFCGRLNAEVPFDVAEKILKVTDSKEKVEEEVRKALAEGGTPLTIVTKAYEVQLVKAQEVAPGLDAIYKGSKEMIKSERFAQILKKDLEKRAQKMKLDEKEITVYAVRMVKSTTSTEKFRQANEQIKMGAKVGMWPACVWFPPPCDE